MTLNDALANVLSTIHNAEQRGRRTCRSLSGSTQLLAALKVLHQHHYLGEIVKEDTSRGMHLEINLLGRINRCGAIKPRYAVTKDGFEKFEKRYLPARDFGIMVVSTQQGMMTHHDAKKKGLGGRLIAYCY